MENYLILKDDWEKAYQNYGYFLNKFSITIIKYTNKDKIAGLLYDKVSPYSDWKLFLVDFSSIDNGANSFWNMYKELEDVLKNNIFFSYGKEKCKPPEKIYVIDIRQENCRIFDAGIDSNEVCKGCRFLIINYSKMKYLKVYEDLKIVSMIILLAHNDISPEILEAYCIYFAELQINIDLLYTFLQKEEEELKREEYYLGRKRLESKTIVDSGIEKEMDYKLGFMVSKPKSLRLSKGFFGIKSQKEQKRWEKEKNELSACIDALTKEQIRSQKDFNKIITERIRLIRTDDLCLENSDIDKIEQEIKDIQKNMNKHYTEIWEMDEGFAERTRNSRQELDKALRNRFSWSELIKIVVCSLVFLIGVLCTCLFAEIQVLFESEMLNSGAEAARFVKENIEYTGRYLILLEVFFLGYIIVRSCIEIKKKFINFNKILGEIQTKIEKNFSHYEKFFSFLYHLKIKESYLVRSQNFRVHRREDMENLAREENELWEKKDSFKTFKQEFIHLAGQDEKMGDKTIYESKINIKNSDKQIENPLFYIQQIFISKIYLFSVDEIKETDNNN